MGFKMVIVRTSFTITFTVDGVSGALKSNSCLSSSFSSAYSLIKTTREKVGWEREGEMERKTRKVRDRDREGREGMRGKGEREREREKGRRRDMRENVEV